MGAKPNSTAKLDFGDQIEVATIPRTRTAKRANELDGGTWTKYSLSIWSDIKKSPEEIALGHPAIFPVALVRRLIQCFTTSAEQVVLDPFSGSGSTLLGAMLAGKLGIGFEIVQSYVEITRSRIAGRHLPFDVRPAPMPVVHQEDARHLAAVLRTESVDFCVTSPPYWDILSQKRTADYKETRDYGSETRDLAKIHGYWEFINELGKVFEQVFKVLKCGGYCVVNVMDIRKKNKFYPFHADLSNRMRSCGFILDDIVIWDRRQDYNNLRPLGYPSVFRVNKVHEYILIFQKPHANEHSI